MIKKIFFIGLILSIISLKPVCDPSFNEKIKKIEDKNETKNPYSKLITLFNNAAIETFVGSDNLAFIRKGLAQGVSPWDQLLECSHTYIKRAISKKNAPREYNETLQKLEKINNVIQRLIQLLHNSYKDSINSKLPEQDITFLTQIKSRLEKLEKTLTRMSSPLIKNMTESIPLDTDFYSESDALPLNRIFPNYTQFFKKYSHALSYFGTPQLKSKQLQHFLYSNKLLTIDPELKKKTLLTQYRYTEEAFYNMLEKFAHTLEEKIAIRSRTIPHFGKNYYHKQTEKLKKMAETSRTIMKQILKFDTQIIPESYASKLPFAQNIPAIMLTSEINNMLGVVEQITLTIDALLQSSMNDKR